MECLTADTSSEKKPPKHGTQWVMHRLEAGMVKANHHFAPNIFIIIVHELWKLQFLTIMSKSCKHKHFVPMNDTNQNEDYGHIKSVATQLYKLRCLHDSNTRFRKTCAWCNQLTCWWGQFSTATPIGSGRQPAAHPRLEFLLSGCQSSLVSKRSRHLCRRVAGLHVVD